MHNDLGNQLSLSDTIDQFIKAMLEQGIETTDEIEADGKLHRFHVTGDSKGSRNGFYCLHFDDKPAGIFGCNKRYGADHKFQWQSTSKSAPWTPEQREAHRQRVAKERAEKDAAEKVKLEEAANAANVIWSKSSPASDTHPYLVSKGVKAHGLRVGKWEKVNQETGEVRLISDNALLVPICDRTRRVHSLQAIFPSKLKMMGDRNKDYMTGGAKRGLFHTIGTKPLAHEGRPVFVLSEGYATGASLHECTGHLVLVCFDASNLKAVADNISARMVEQGKDVIILIAADNDRWTHQPIENPGVHHAINAAKGVAGLVAIPEFADLSGEPTDFNDLHQREGAEAVVNAIAAALNPPAKEQADDAPWGDEPVQATAPQPEKAPEQNNSQPAQSDQSSAELQQSLVSEDELDDEVVKNGYFAILGYNSQTYYIFHQEKKQVLSLSKGDLRGNGLSEIAPLNWWEENFPGEKGVNEKQAANWFFRVANSRGLYDPSRTRGKGAWIDKGRFVYHLGDRLLVDGVEVALGYIKSAYVYPCAAAIKIRNTEPMTQEEGQHLLDVANMVRWRKPASAALMAGWVMLAPICGALKWRPHIWLTGAAGSGKSSVQDSYIASLTSGINVYAQGNSTEAGIRQMLKGDALPVLVDEAESNNDREKLKMENIIAMIRQSSSESQAQTLKGTAHGETMVFNIRSMFCLASVNTNVDKKADTDRLTKLIIKPPMRTQEEKEAWDLLKEDLHKISTDDEISSRLMLRAVTMLPTIIQNIGVFVRVAAKFFGTQREGDQLGTMMAGAWSLCHDEVVSDAQAMAMLEAFDWREHTEDSDMDDSVRALNEILNAKIRMGSIGDLSVYELMKIATSGKTNHVVSISEAEASLVRHGIKVNSDDGIILFGNSVPNLKKLIEHSAYSTDLRGQLMRLKGATNHRNVAIRFSGVGSKCVAVPMSLIFDGDTESSSEPPI